MAISHQKTDSAPQRYGPGRNFIIQAVKLAWPVIKAGKKLSNVPVLRWLIFIRRRILGGGLRPIAESSL
jgi:hypothetical protein